MIFLVDAHLPRRLANKRLELTAFGARDRDFFEVVSCSAPWPQLNAKPLNEVPLPRRIAAHHREMSPPLI